MKAISNFYTLFWIIYFPTCIAFNELPGFSSIDEVMTVVLMAYTFAKKGKGSTNKKPWKEYLIFLCILVGYILYSFYKRIVVPGAIWLDLVQQIRPYSVLFCTWILNPQFTKKQKWWMMLTMILTLGAWILFHPSTTEFGNDAEFPILGQLAICTGMSYYLFTNETKKNKRIALLLVSSGLLAPKMKFVGEVVCFIAVMYYLKSKLDYKSPKTIFSLCLLIALCIAFTWTRFDRYYVSGFQGEVYQARPISYLTSIQILKDYFPFGPGMGTFATNAAWKFYSPLYPKYGLNHIWGLTEGGGFICDAYYPSLAQFGVVGVFLFLWFWKRRLTDMQKIADMKYYRVALMAFFCLAIESVADSSYLSGKGMGYFMLLAICLNATRLQAPSSKEESQKEEHSENEYANLVKWNTGKQKVVVVNGVPKKR